MKEEKMLHELEIFICNHRRDDSENCFDKGAKELTDQVKKWAKENHGKRIKIYRSGCVGKCSEGIAIACYPERKFLLEVTKDDAQKIMEGLEETLQKS